MLFYIRFASNKIIITSLYFIPDEICQAVENIVSKTVPHMSVKEELVPNYEGRLMSIILFTLKLLFGFDGMTEFNFSKYAKLVNNTSKQNMFDVIAWIKCIAYRNLFMKMCHFPTYHINNTEVNSDLLLQYIASQNVLFPSEASLTREMKDFEELLVKMKNCQYDNNMYNVFPASLTPFTTYVEILSKLENKKFMKPILDQSYTTDKIDFLLRPNSYLNFLENVKVKNGGANDKWFMNDIKKFRTTNKKRHKFVIVEIINDGSDILDTFDDDSNFNKNRDISIFQEAYQKYRKHIFHKNFKYLERTCRYVHHNNIPSEHSYETHYNPFERYWLNCITDIDLINKKEFDTFFQSHTYTFKVVFDECSRVIEQSHNEFFKEFQLTELFLTYSSALLKKNSFRPKRILDSQLNYYIQQAEGQW